MTEPQRLHPILTTSKGYQDAEKRRDLKRSLRDQAVAREQQLSIAYEEERNAWRADRHRLMEQGVLPTAPEPVPPRNESEQVRELTRDLVEADSALRRDSFDPDWLQSAMRDRQEEIRAAVLAVVAEALRPYQAELSTVVRTAALAVAVEDGRLEVSPPGSAAALVAWAEGGASLVDVSDPFDVESATFERVTPMTQADAKRAISGGSRDAWAARR